MIYTSIICLICVIIIRILINMLLVALLLSLPLLLPLIIVAAATDTFIVITLTLLSNDYNYDSSEITENDCMKKRISNCRVAVILIK